jgi:hypothetical protein
LPVLAVIGGFTGGGGGAARRLAWLLAILLLVNLVPISIVHYRWEIGATRRTNEQLSRLRQSSLVEVDFQYFGEPFGERLRAAGVKFTPVQSLECATPIELMSVSPGYPMAVRVCLKD